MLKRLKTHHRNFKYKIYRKLKSDVFGAIILKKKFDNITSLILSYFEYRVRGHRKFMRRWMQKYYKTKKIFLKSKFQAIKSNKDTLKFDNCIIKSIGSYNLKIFISRALRIKRKLYRLWKIKKLRLDLYNFNKNFELKMEDAAELNEQQTQSSIKAPYYKKRYKEDTYDFRGLVIAPSIQKKKLAGWLKTKIKEKRMSLFYGFKNIKKFKILQDAAFYANKLRANGIMKLEGMLSTVIFRLNFAPSCYMARQMIVNRLFKVSGQLIVNPTFQIKIFQDISLSDINLFEYFAYWIGIRLKYGVLFLNVPNYMEINYNIMHASFWRYPLKDEIIGSYVFPFGRSPYDWSVSSVIIRQ